MGLEKLSGVELRDAFAAGVYLLFGIVHFDLWLKRRDRPSHLWLATAAGGALLVDLTGMALRGSDVSRGILPALNLLGVTLVTASLLQLVYSLGEGRTDRLTRAAVFVSLVLALLCGLGGIASLIPLFFVICGALLLRALVHAVRAARGGDRESRAIAGGLVVLLLCLIIDVLRELGLIPIGAGLPIAGFTVMFLVAASALNSRFEREHRELELLRKDLEERVSTRTQELEEANLRLAEASRTDALTGLPNRRGFFDVADHELKRSARSGEPLSVLMIDLDHFKRINDAYGHAEGDGILQFAASTLRSVLRAQDVVARWGGEEFIALLPATDGEMAILAAEKARLALSAAPFESERGTGTITGSFGVAAHHAGEEFEATIAAADRAMYAAKDAGRNCVRSADPEFGEQAESTRS